MTRVVRTYMMMMLMCRVNDDLKFYVHFSSEMSTRCPIGHFGETDWRAQWPKWHQREKSSDFCADGVSSPGHRRVV